MNIKIKKSIIWGTAGGLLLLALYFLILILANSLGHAFEQFKQIWYLIIILAFGFGWQVGLYVYARELIRQQKMKGLKAAIATSGSISTVSMVACCLHHLTDILPIIGLTAATVFLTRYQLLFIAVGIFSNLVGITLMLRIIIKHKKYLKLQESNFLNNHESSQKNINYCRTITGSCHISHRHFFRN